MEEKKNHKDCDCEECECTEDDNCGCLDECTCEECDCEEECDEDCDCGCKEKE